MKKIKVAICDDNLEERKYFVKLCSEIGKENQILIKLKEYEHGDALLFDMGEPKIRSAIDIVLLDIHMPGKNGIDVAHDLRKYGYKGIILFVTVSKKHLRNAFEVKAFNYIIKQYDSKNHFKKVFLDAVEEAANRQKATLLLTSIGETRQIAIKDISRFEVDSHVVTAYYNNESFEFPSSLAKLENITFGHGFVRTHRSHLISTFYIAKFTEKEVTMADGTVIPVSRRYYSQLKAEMAQRTIL